VHLASIEAHLLGWATVNNYSPSPTAVANRQARQICGTVVRSATVNIVILAQVVRENPGLTLKQLAPLLKDRASWVDPISAIKQQMASGLNRLGKAKIRVEHGRGGKPTRLWPEVQNG